MAPNTVGSILDHWRRDCTESPPASVLERKEDGGAGTGVVRGNAPPPSKHAGTTMQRAIRVGRGSRPGGCHQALPDLERHAARFEQNRIAVRTFHGAGDSAVYSELDSTDLHTVATTHGACPGAADSC